MIRKLTSRKAEPETPKDDPDPGGTTRSGSPCRRRPGCSARCGTCDTRGRRRSRGRRSTRGTRARGPSRCPAPTPCRLVVDGQSLTTPVEVRLDPRVTVSPADLEEQLAFALALREDLTRLAGIVHDLRSVREQVKARAASLRGVTAAAPLVRGGGRARRPVRRPGGEAPQPEGRGHVRHPREARRGEALLAPRAALLVVPRRGRPPDPGHAGGLRRAEDGARRARRGVEGDPGDRRAGLQREGSRAGPGPRRGAGQRAEQPIHGRATGFRGCDADPPGAQPWTSRASSQSGTGFGTNASTPRRRASRSASGEP